MARAPSRSKSQSAQPEMGTTANEPTNPTASESVMEEKMTIEMPSVSANAASHEPEQPKPDAPPVGEQLRRERERQGITIESVAQMLKIRRVYLIALENSNWADLPEQVYVNGFIRSYANFLGIQIQHPIPKAKTEIINLPSLPKLEVPQPIDDQQLPSPTMIILAALGLFFLYAVWTAIHTESNTTPSALQSDIASENEGTEKTLASAAVPASPTPTLSDEPALIKSSDSVPAAIAPAPTSTPTVYGATTGAVHAVITALEDSWIQIKNKEGQIVFSVMMHGKDSYRVPQEPGLVLLSTNVSGLKFELDGKPIAPPADVHDATSHGLMLSPDQFLKPEIQSLEKTSAVPTSKPTASITPATPAPIPTPATPVDISAKPAATPAATPAPTVATTGGTTPAAVSATAPATTNTTTTAPVDISKTAESIKPNAPQTTPVKKTITKKKHSPDDENSTSDFTGSNANDEYEYPSERDHRF